MSCGSKFLKKTKTNELIIDRMHIVNAMETYLRSICVIKDEQDITNIQFSDLFGESDTELCTLKIQYGGAKTT